MKWAVGEMLRRMHLDFMNGADLLEAHSFVEELWNTGVLTTQQAEQWKNDFSRCPEGYENHLGSRSWCAYCGTIYSHTCEQCGLIKDLRTFRDDYLFMEAQASHGPLETYCRSCWKYIGLFNSDNKYGLHILGQPFEDPGVYLCSCKTTIYSGHPDLFPLVLVVISPRKLGN